MRELRPLAVALRLALSAAVAGRRSPRDALRHNAPRHGHNAAAALAGVPGESTAASVPPPPPLSAPRPPAQRGRLLGYQKVRALGRSSGHRVAAACAARTSREVRVGRAHTRRLSRNDARAASIVVHCCTNSGALAPPHASRILERPARRRRRAAR